MAVTNDSDVIQAVRAQLLLPEPQRQRVINGPIARGDGEHNEPWSWHFAVSGWELVGSTVELCDGTPEMVEDDLDYWVDHLGYFCPWAAYVVEER